MKETTSHKYCGGLEQRRNIGLGTLAYRLVVEHVPFADVSFCKITLVKHLPM